VEAEEQGVVAVAGVGGDQVPDLIALHLATELTETLLQVEADCFLVAGRAIDGYEVEEVLEKAVSINEAGGLIAVVVSHSRSSVVRMSVFRGYAFLILE
jgi:hypothetical protein